MSADESIQPILDAQFGLITQKQAQARGMTRGTFEHRVRTKRLLRVHARVYRSPSAPETFEQKVLAACLATGGIASDLTAAMVFGAIDRTDGRPHVNVDQNRRVPNIVVHRAKLDRQDRTHYGSIPVTSIPRTLVDLAASLERRALAEAVDRMLRRKLVSAERLDRIVIDDRFDRAKGIRMLREIIRDRLRSGYSDSVLEADAFEVLREFNLPLPERGFGVRVKGRPVVFDLAYPDARLAIELDGKAPHTELPTWQRDHNRHNAVELDDEWRALHFTWWDVHDTPVYFVATVADGLGLRPRKWGY